MQRTAVRWIFLCFCAFSWREEAAIGDGRCQSMVFATGFTSRFHLECMHFLSKKRCLPELSGIHRRLRRTRDACAAVWVREVLLQARWQLVVVTKVILPCTRLRYQTSHAWSNIVATTFAISERGVSFEANVQKGDSSSNNIMTGHRNVVWPPDVADSEFGTYFPTR